MRYIISLLLASTSLPAFADAPKVVTDIPPVHALVAQVMGDLAAPVLLLEKGADEHDFALRPSQMRDIAGADLVVWIGPALTPWLDRALAANPAPALGLLDATGTQTLPFAAEGEHAEHDEHDHGAIDPHAWMAPANASLWLDLIAARLAELDAPNAATYRSNAAAAKTRIAAMDAEIAAQLAPVADKNFVTFHAAYGYFTAHYHLHGAGSLALGDASAPGAARLSALAADMASGHYTCAFPEIQHDPALLTQIMAGDTVKLGAPLDPVGSSLDFGPNAYDDLMRGIANTLSDCLAP
jgi:zinc transport system substrate-binding protein